MELLSRDSVRGADFVGMIFEGCKSPCSVESFLIKGGRQRQQVIEVYSGGGVHFEVVSRRHGSAYVSSVRSEGATTKHEDDEANVIM